MANTINDLYLKYVNKVGKTLENDRYFQYLFEMVQSGSNTLTQSSQILHKVVDERWLTTIEESLDAINNIIDKPRRFVTTNEEVVPVALAKKISAESVRHLSMNTQFIASDEDGDIQPTRILNVSTEESYDLYENRFIYHLIQRLVNFIDKRTDVIFWSTGDEKSNKLVMESKVDDAYEEIQYKVEMTIKNRQSFAENDSDNMNVFMRIDRVRRLVMALRNSAFCSLMAGCAKVRSPIQRTNLMMKDPNYRTCYKLWQFLESYDEVGYTIEQTDTAMEFDEDYLFQMYTNMITNYTVFKSLMDDSRNLTEVGRHHKERKPKFIKKVIEQEVDNPDLPDVEIRQVFVEEVTKRQLELEEEVKEKNARLEEETAAREDAEIRAQQAGWELKSLQQEHSAAQARAAQDLEDAKAVAAKELAEARSAAEKDVEAARDESARNLLQARIVLQEQAKHELEEVKAAAAREIAEAKASAARELEEARAAAARELAKVQGREQKALELARSESAVRKELEEREEARRRILEEERRRREREEEERQERLRLAEEEKMRQREEYLKRSLPDPDESLSTMIENLSRRNRTSQRGRKGKK